MTFCCPKLLALLFAVGLTTYTCAQAQQTTDTAPAPPANWHLLDNATNGYMGISLNKAYQLIKTKKSTTIVVATMDSGIDTAQRDLQGSLWVNPKEVAGNGKDDDHNGYADDVHGWNFLGGSNGKTDVNECREEVREYFKLKPLMAGADSSSRPDFAYWQKIRDSYTKLITKERDDLNQYTPIMNVLETTDAIIKRQLKLPANGTFTAKELGSLNLQNDTLANSVTIWQQVFKQTPGTPNDGAVLKDLTDAITQLNNDINPDIDARIKITGNSADDNSTRFYGNNILKNADCSHGTMVAGLIAATRNNGYGIDGVADNVKIMAVKVVPMGDEFDKDVANGIHYAVDNGARIINMSFGKNLSPHKAWVDEAIQYAAKKSVLIVIAAGNENQNTDEKIAYPSRVLADGTIANNVLVVGASGPAKNENLPAFFSNYGQKTVDVFAPGVKVTSVDKDTEVNTEDGTSLSAPITSGIAALVLSRYPKLSARQLKQVLLASATPLNLTVLKPGNNGQKVPFASLCKTGGVVNAYEALKFAATLKPELK